MFWCTLFVLIKVEKMLQLHLFPTYLFVTFCHNYSVKKYSLQSLVWHQSCLVLLALHCICYCRIPIDTTDEERCTRDDLIFREFHKSVHHLFVLEFFVVNFFLANCSFDISWIKKQKCEKKKCCRKKSLRRWKGGKIGLYRIWKVAGLTPRILWLQAEASVNKKLSPELLLTSRWAPGMAAASSISVWMAELS